MTNMIPSDLFLLPVGDTPPGRWISHEDRQVWHGPTRWLEQRKGATILYDHGAPSKAWGVHLKNGNSGEAEKISAYNWRFQSGTDVMVGVLDMETMIFHEVISRYEPPTIGLEADIWSHIDFRALLRKRPFMAASFSYLTSNAFRRDTMDHGRVRFSPDETSAMLSRMRGWGDAAMSFDDPSFEYHPHHLIMFEEILEDVSWHALTPEEFALDHIKALKILDRLDAVPAGHVPVSQQPKALHFRALTIDGGKESISPRLRRAINEGRCSNDDMNEIIDLIDFDDERMLADLDALRGR